MADEKQDVSLSVSFVPDYSEDFVKTMTKQDLGEALSRMIISQETNALDSLLHKIQTATLLIDSILNKSTFGETQRPLIVIAACENNIEAIQTLMKYKVEFLNIYILFCYVFMQLLIHIIHEIINNYLKHV